jgi:hypothetical protein
MDPRTEQLLAERARKTAAIPPFLRGAFRALNDFKVWVDANRRTAMYGAVAGVIVMFAGYYWLVALPAQRFELEAMKAAAAARLGSETVARQQAVDDCLSKAKSEADERWNAACKARRERTGCALSARQTSDLQRKESDARNACLVRSSTAQ